MLLDQLPNGEPSKNEKYYLLSDVLPEDYELRWNLHTKRLEKVLEQHQFERTDRNFHRGCLYCRDSISPTRYDFLEHLFTKHYLQLGKPTNLVYISELIDLIEDKMQKLICLYCEKIFKDRATLKEHMRKKGHKRINPENKIYDKFFLVNYKCFKTGKQSNKQKLNEKKAKRPKSPPSHVFQTDDSDSDWSDWEGEKEPIICLFCSKTETDLNIIKEHLQSEHNFDFKVLDSYNFYQKIKIVNCIRRHMHLMQCIVCNKTFKNAIDLQKHMADENHCIIGEKLQWDQPEFFFSTYEDDALLCYLEDTAFEDDGNLSEDSGAIVFSEDAKISINRDAEELSKENVNKILSNI